MILCPKCGKVKTYKVREIIAREVIYDESGWVCDWKFVNDKEGEPRCIKCGRLVKFFNDAEEVEDEKTGDHERTV